MSSKSRRGPQRPQLGSEQMQQMLRGGALGAGRIGRHLSRQDALLLAVGFAVNLAKMWNGPDSPPFMRATVEKRSTGVSLHVDMLEGTDESDAV